LEAASGSGAAQSAGSAATYSPFADLKDRLEKKKPGK
jgi:hypothetical protein